MSDSVTSLSVPPDLDGVVNALVVVPCSRRKIGHSEPFREPTSAAPAHTGTPFRLNRQYAEHFSDAWVALGAKFGFFAPDVSIPEAYEVGFKYPATGPITLDRLCPPVRELQLDRYPVIVGLEGRIFVPPSKLPWLTCRPASPLSL